MMSRSWVKFRWGHPTELPNTRGLPLGNFSTRYNWPDSVMVKTLACDSRGLQFDLLPGSDLGQVVHTHVPLPPNNLVPVTGQLCHATGKVTVGFQRH